MYELIYVNGKPIKLRLISKPYKYLTHGNFNDLCMGENCAKCKSGIRPSFRWLIACIHDNEIKILKLSYDGHVSIKDLANNSSYGDPQKYDIELSYVPFKFAIKVFSSCELTEEHQKLKDSLNPDWFNQIIEFYKFYS